MKRIFISMTGIITCMNLMAQTPVSFYPQENDQDINIDTHLVIVFDQTVKTGSKGIITVTDKTTRGCSYPQCTSGSWSAWSQNRWLQRTIPLRW